MARRVVSVVFAAALALLASSGVAFGQNQNNQGSQSGGGAIRAPEFDPAAVGVVTAIVAGGAILLARRRRDRAP